MGDTTCCVYVAEFSLKNYYPLQDGVRDILLYPAMRHVLGFLNRQGRFLVKSLKIDDVQLRCGSILGSNLRNDCGHAAAAHMYERRVALEARLVEGEGRNNRNDGCGSNGRRDTGRLREGDWPERSAGRFRRRGDLHAG